MISKATSPKALTDASQAWVRPEILAAKLAAIRNFEYPDLLEQLIQTPHLVELLWFIQGMSMQPGGLGKFTADLVAEFPDRVGTGSMLQAPGTPSKPYTVNQVTVIWEELPWYCHEAMKGKDFEGWREFLELDNATNAIWERADSDEIENDSGSRSERETDARERKSPKAFELAKLTRNDFAEVCQAAVLKELPRHLAALCNEPGRKIEGIWCIHDLIDTLFAMMDRHAQQAAQNLAKTEVVVKVFDTLDYAASENVLVQIQGDSRFGKTEAIQTWCAMRPGQARLVTVPCSNCDADFFKAVADAMGIVYGLKTTRQGIKDSVEYVSRHGRLMIVLDEAHFILPVRYSENTPPMRMNWIRTQIVDRHIPCVLVSTPQSYRQAVNKFVRKTGYSIEQFLGRVALQVNLPAELSEEDLLAVARIHFPELDEDYLGLIAAKAMQSEAYLKAMENISRRARYIARRTGKAEITIEDVEQAIEEVLPGTMASPVARTPGRVSRKPAKKASDELLQPFCKPREIAPGPAHSRINFDSDTPPSISEQRHEKEIIPA